MRWTHVRRPRLTQPCDPLVNAPIRPPRSQRVLAQVDVARQQPLVYHSSTSEEDVSDKPLVILLGWLMSKQVRAGGRL